MKSEPNFESEYWRALRADLERGFASLGPKDRVDDSIQESLLALVSALRAGVLISDAAGWCAVIVRRRLIDSKRRLRRQVLGRDLDRLVKHAEPAGDWLALLRGEGSSCRHLTATFCSASRLGAAETAPWRVPSGGT